MMILDQSINEIVAMHPENEIMKWKRQVRRLSTGIYRL
jgi:hypothetical protein